MRLSRKVVAAIRSALTDFALDPEGVSLEASIDATTDRIVSLVETGGSGKVPAEVVDEAYERFMAEFKPLGVWQGGKVVKAKLAKILADGQIEEVWAGLARLAADPNRPDKHHVPRPVTWLNQERWNDDPYPARGGRMAPGGSVLNIDLGSNRMGAVRPEISAAGMREIARRQGPSILDDIRNGGAR